MLGAFFIFFGIGCFIGIVYVVIRYLIPTIIWGFGQVGQGLGEVVQAGREGWQRGVEKNRAKK